MSNTPIATNYLIAGHNNSGIRVKANSADVFATYQNLESLGSKNDYWANEIVKTLKSLSSGHIKDSVYINELTKGKWTTFDIVMPGCKALVLKRTNSEYLVLKVIQDATYFNAQRKGAKPGLYSATKSRGKFVSTFVINGQVKDEKDRVVTITDQYEKMGDVVGLVAPLLNDIPAVSGGELTISKNGFDMHFTPGDKKIGGMRNIKQAFNAATDPSLRESAMLLAATMERAKSIDGVRWISEGGGSGVLTQTMQILKNKGVNFDKSNHYAFFSHLTTNIVTAEGLARDIGLKFGRDTKKISPGNLNELIGGLGIGGGTLAALYRFKRDPEHTALQFSVDIYKEVSSLTGVGSLVRSAAPTVAAAVGFSVASGAAAASMPASITFAAAAFGVAKIGNTFAEAWARTQYNKIKGKF